jgi:hypothetical protein
MREMINACKYLVREPGRKRPHGTPKYKWDDNIQIN